ncbi:MAG: type II toxin-antitoxin system HicB family antitoxin [Desulfovibrionaceae bacterium]|nr:type II toxin-antitoxin system HicB family antitoxin [Desulfovibrionaceae bacterium]
MRKYSLSIFWSDEDDAFVALSPEFPGMSAAGDNREEALKEAQYAMDTMEDMAKKNGDTLPCERKLPDHSGQFRIRIPRSLHTALALEAERQGVSLNSLVQMLLTQGITEKHCFDTFVRLLRMQNMRNSHTTHISTVNLIFPVISNDSKQVSNKSSLLYNTKIPEKELCYGQ